MSDDDEDIVGIVVLSFSCLLGVVCMHFVAKLSKFLVGLALVASCFFVGLAIKCGLDRVVNALGLSLYALFGGYLIKQISPELSSIRLLVRIFLLIYCLLQALAFAFYINDTEGDTHMYIRWFAVEAFVLAFLCFTQLVSVSVPTFFFLTSCLTFSFSVSGWSYLRSPCENCQ